MKKFLIGCLIFSACSTGHHIAVMNAYTDIPIGASKEEVVAQLGNPDNTKQRSDGTVEYEYVERIKQGARNMEERRYILVLKDGKVISKEVKQQSPPAFTFDSYDMQTTQN